MIRIISSMTCYEILIYYVKENLDVELSLIDVRERGEWNWDSSQSDCNLQFKMNLVTSLLPNL